MTPCDDDVVEASIELHDAVAGAECVGEFGTATQSAAQAAAVALLAGRNRLDDVEARCDAILARRPEQGTALFCLAEVCLVVRRSPLNNYE